MDPLESDPNRALTYADAGVSIDEGEALVAQIKASVSATKRPGTDASIGGFGALFDLRAAGFSDPILVATTDGVGTKLKIAIDTDRLDDIGIDLVAMCVNDLLAQGAEPLFFLDYYATGQLRARDAARIVSGIARGCQLAGCALVGGETAEMPGLYAGKDFDLAGFAVGASERGSVLPRQADMQAGDLMIALPSNGAHSNGYSLIRKIVTRSQLHWDAPAPFATGSLADQFLAPTRLYVRDLLPLFRSGTIKGLAHITGGGLIENPKRALPNHLTERFDDSSWSLPPLFAWLQDIGKVEAFEMRRTFNCGIGMVLFVAPSQADAVLGTLNASISDPEAPRAWICGEVVAAS